MILLNFDLAGAEWVVVAYVSGDQNMIEVTKTDKSPHLITGSLISGAPEPIVGYEHKIVGTATDPDEIASLRAKIPDEIEGHKVEWEKWFVPRSMSMRQAGKKSNHGLNYDMKYRRFALENEIPETEAKSLVHLYNHVAYPGLPDWRARVKDQLRKDRTLVNCFGRKVRLLGEWGPDLHNKAFAFNPQSTVFDVCREAFCQVYESDDPVLMDAEYLAQVHDSLLYQYDDSDPVRLADFCLKVRDLMGMPLSWEGRQFSLGVDLKLGYKWGDASMEELKLPDSASELARTLGETLPTLRKPLRDQAA